MSDTVFQTLLIPNVCVLGGVVQALAAATSLALPAVPDAVGRGAIVLQARQQATQVVVSQGSSSGSKRTHDGIVVTSDKYDSMSREALIELVRKRDSDFRQLRREHTALQKKFVVLQQKQVANVAQHVVQHPDAAFEIARRGRITDYHNPCPTLQ
jgi:type IV pilus biogenesis protein CpaD/CtpE